jgi:hypothetical protein
MTMNSFAASAYRALACLAAAALITLVVSMSFAHATAVPPTSSAPVAVLPGAHA